MYFDPNRLKHVVNVELIKVNPKLNSALNLASTIKIPNGFQRAGDVRDLKLWIQNIKDENSKLTKNVNKTIKLLENSVKNGIELANGIKDPSSYNPLITANMIDYEYYEMLLKNADPKIKSKFKDIEKKYGVEYAIGYFGLEYNEEFKKNLGIEYDGVYKYLPESEREKLKKLSYDEQLSEYLKHYDEYKRKSAEKYEIDIEEEFKKYRENRFAYYDPSQAMYDELSYKEGLKLYKRNNGYLDEGYRKLAGNTIGLTLAGAEGLLKVGDKVFDAGIFVFGMSAVEICSYMGGDVKRTGTNAIKDIIACDWAEEFRNNTLNNNNSLLKYYKHANEEFRAGGLVYDFTSNFIDNAVTKTIETECPYLIPVLEGGRNAEEVMKAAQGNDDVAPSYLITDILLRTTTDSLTVYGMQNAGHNLKTNLNQYSLETYSGKNSISNIINYMGINATVNGGTATLNDSSKMFIDYTLSKLYGKNEEETFKHLYGDCIDNNGNFDIAKAAERESSIFRGAALNSLKDDGLGLVKSYGRNFEVYKKDNNFQMNSFGEVAENSVSWYMEDVEFGDLDRKTENEMISDMFRNHDKYDIEEEIKVQPGENVPKP